MPSTRRIVRSVIHSHATLPARWRHLTRAASCAATLLASSLSMAATPTISLRVDASDIARNFVRSEMTIAMPSGPGEVLFCIWTPGNHTPSGPIENVVDLVVRDCRGERLAWDRDPAHLERVRFTVPEGCGEVRVEMGYIASQPSVNSRSTDTYGRASMGVLNWNTVLFYPAGKTNQQITVQASLAIPEGWTLATPLPRAEGTAAPMTTARPASVTGFASVPLAELIDTPVIMGRHVATHEMKFDLPGVGPHSISIAAPEARFTQVPDWLLAKYTEMCRQTMLVFAVPGKPLFPRDQYEFLLAMEDTLGFGVEHATSTLIGMKAATIIDAKQDDVRGGGATTTVIPHEYFHVWCGKLVAPEGLVRSEYSSPAEPELLWVYEGLTTYYDNIVAVRAGLLSPEEYRHELLAVAVALEQRSGRLWRSVEDTARAARTLRQRGLYWFDRRRGQEYYMEGAMFWTEADAIIRAASNGARSLDDFCREFFDRDVNPTGAQATYTRADVIAALEELEPGTDWDALVRARIEEPVPTLDLSPLLARLGWKIEYSDEPTAEQKKLKVFDEENADEPNLRTSLGLRVNKAGEITDIVPDSPADRAGLGYGMVIVAVDGWVYAPSRLRTAVKESSTTGKIELLTSFGGRVEPRTIEYSGGPRVPRLVRVPGTTDVLEAVMAPLGSSKR